MAVCKVRKDRYILSGNGGSHIDSEGGHLSGTVPEELEYIPEGYKIFSASGTDDFAYSAFKTQISAMGNVADGTFRFADNEDEGNLAFLERYEIDRLERKYAG